METPRISRGPVEDGEDAPGGLTAAQVGRALRRSRFWLIFLALLGAAGGGLYAVTTPNTYSSTVKFMVRWGAREQTPVDSVDGPQRGAASSRFEDIQTEVQLLDTPVVFERASRRYGPARLLAPHDPTEGDDETTPKLVRWFHQMQKVWFARPTAEPRNCCTDHSCPRCIEAAMRDFQLRSTIAAEVSSSIISVSCKAATPEEAQQLVTALAAEIEERHLEFFSSDPSYEFLKKQMNDAKDERDAAMIRLSDMRTQCRVYDIGAQQAQLLKSLNDVDAAALSERTEIKSLKAQILQYKSWLGAAKEAKPETTMVQMPNPAYEPRLRHVEELRSEREKLLITRLPESDEVKALDRQIQAAEDTLKETKPFILAESSVALSQQVQRYQTEIETLGARERGLEATADANEARRAAIEEQQQQLANCEPELRRLEKEYDTKSADAGRFTEAFDRYAVAKALENARMSNLRRIQDASIPFERIGPNRRVFPAVGLFLGLSLGFLLALARAGRDRSLGGPDEVEKALGVGVICALPEVRKLRRAGS